MGWNQMAWLKHQLHPLLSLWPVVRLLSLPEPQSLHLKNGFHDNSLSRWSAGLNKITDTNSLVCHSAHSKPSTNSIFFFLIQSVLKSTDRLAGSDMARDRSPELCLLWKGHSYVSLFLFDSPLLWPYIISGASDASLKHCSARGTGLASLRWPAHCLCPAVGLVPRSAP